MKEKNLVPANWRIGVFVLWWQKTRKNELTKNIKL